MTLPDQPSPFENLLFEGAPPPPPHVAALGQRFVDEAALKFRNFRVDLEAVQSRAVAAAKKGDISDEDAAMLWLDHGDTVSHPLVQRYNEVCETELIARWLMALPSYHFSGWATPRNLAALEGMVAAGEQALAVRVVRKHLEKVQSRARDCWRLVGRKRPSVIPPDMLARYEAQMEQARWELPGVIDAAQMEIAELDQTVRTYGSLEDNRALDTMLANLARARKRFNIG